MWHLGNSLNPGIDDNNWISLHLVSSDLSNKHCSHFFRTNACNNSSLQASPHQKVGLRVNNCRCLGFSCNGINCHFNTWSIRIWERISLLIAVILFFVSIGYVSYSSIVVKFLCGAHPQHHGAVRRQGKLTVTLFIMTIVSLLMWLPHAVFIFLPSSKFLSFQESSRLNYSLNSLVLMNSLVNPIVYTIRIPEFRKALLVLFKRQQRQNADVIHLHVR